MDSAGRGTEKPTSIKYRNFDKSAEVMKRREKREEGRPETRSQISGTRPNFVLFNAICDTALINRYVNAR